MNIDFLSLFPMIGLPVLAAILTAILIPLARRLAIRANYVDNPGGRKHHAEPVPPVGGICIFLVFMLLGQFIDPDVGDMRAYYAALMMILITGIFDDAFSVPASLKFLIHFAAAFIIVYFGGARLENLGNLLGFGEIIMGPTVSVLFSVACVVYIINAVNMMDGIDGLAGGKTFIILAWLMMACGLHGWWEAFTGLAVLAGCLAGFLIYNMQHPFRDRANIFLGDAGSMALGLSIAWFCIGLSQGDGAVVAPVSVAWIIALPIIDSFGLLVMRLRNRQHPFAPDRRHFHHHFLNAGFSVRQSTAIILCLGLALGTVGFVGYVKGIPEPVLGWAWVVLWLGHACLVMKPDPFIRLLVRLRGGSVKTPETRL